MQAVNTFGDNMDERITVPSCSLDDNYCKYTLLRNTVHVDGAVD